MSAQVNNSPALIIFNTVTMKRPQGLDKTYTSLRGAKTALTAHKKRAAAWIEKHNARVLAGGYGNLSDGVEEQMKDIMIGTYADFAKLDTMVESYNMLGEKGNVVMIRKSEVGTCCDPSTNRYHEM